MKHQLIIILLLVSFIGEGCRKIIAIDPPVNSITTSQVFTSAQQAVAVSAGIYSDLINNNFGFANGGMTLFTGLSGDELQLFIMQSNDPFAQFQINSIDPTNDQLMMNLWVNPFNTIYKANALIEGLNNYSSIDDSVKNELLGQAKFIRAFCNFYLVNLFGEIPLVSTTNYTYASLLPQTSISGIYENIIADLTEAKQRLSEDFSVGNGERIIPNKGAATAMLARVYLYTQQYEKAITESTELIAQSDRYKLLDLESVFIKNSFEAIWQLQQDNTGLNPGYNTTYEGFRFIPYSTDNPPYIILTDTLVNSFQENDLRKSWIDSFSYNNTPYYYPFKYKQGPLQAEPNATRQEYYMVLRLAEQYLIRAEALLNLNKSQDAIEDLNTIRERAGLEKLTFDISSDSIRIEMEEQRKFEFFAEWGHRWLDIKRTNRASAVFTQLKSPYWENTDVLYPIPLAEITFNPNLRQNPGY